MENKYDNIKIKICNNNSWLYIVQWYGQINQVYEIYMKLTRTKMKRDWNVQ